jgi:histidinol phosphatase-like enzyme (inositol monophosphatase family)
MTEPDLRDADADALIEAAAAAADAARLVIKPFFRAGLDAESKSDESPVTLADRNAETAIRSVLSARYPSFGVLGEEFGLERPEARFRWVIDPIDGTRAFITGRPTFGTLVALLDRDRPMLGVIDQPITGERWIGFAGRPTIFTGPYAGRAGVRECRSLQHAELSCTSPEIIQPEHRGRWNQLAAQVRRTSWGGDCYAYGLLALGQIDLIVETGLKVWDWAALQPVIAGAGGLVTDWQGQALRPEGDGRVLAVGDPALHALALEYLRP